MEKITTTIRSVLDTHAFLAVPISSLSDFDDLYASGMTSHVSVNVMLALEDEFDVEFPDAVLRRSTFESINAIREALLSLGASDEP